MGNFIDSRASAWLGALRDLAYPPSCPACFAPARLVTEAEILCTACSDDLWEIHPPVCSICSEPYAGDLDADFCCTNCRDRQLGFDFATSKFRSRGAARDLVHRMKYQQQRWLRLPLGKMVAQAIRDDQRIDDLHKIVLVPVPIHPLRGRERGFNQAAEIAHTCGRFLGVPVVDCLVRHQPTSPQAHLGRAERLANLEGAFGFGRKRRSANIEALNGRLTIVIDDVLTTGATAHHAALALRQAATPTGIVVATATRA